MYHSKQTNGKSPEPLFADNDKNDLYDIQASKQLHIDWYVFFQNVW